MLVLDEPSVACFSKTKSRSHPVFELLATFYRATTPNEAIRKSHIAAGRDLEIVKIEVAHFDGIRLPFSPAFSVRLGSFVFHGWQDIENNRIACVVREYVIELPFPCRLGPPMEQISNLYFLLSWIVCHLILF